MTFFSARSWEWSLHWKLSIPWKLISQWVFIRFFWNLVQKFFKPLPTQGLKIPSCRKNFFNFPSKRVLESFWNVVKKLQNIFRHTSTVSLTYLRLSAGELWLTGQGIPKNRIPTSGGCGKCLKLHVNCHPKRSRGWQTCNFRHLPLALEVSIRFFGIPWPVSHNSRARNWR